MNRKHYIVLGAIVAALVAESVLGWTQVIKPAKAEIAKLEAEKDDVSKKLQEAKSKAAQYDKFRALSENIRRDLNFVVQRLDGDLGRKELYRMFAELANSPDLTKQTFVIAKRDKSRVPGFSALDEVPVTFDFLTNYHGLGNFLNAAVSNRRVLIPVSFSMTEAKETGEISGPTVHVTALALSVFLEGPK